MDKLHQDKDYLLSQIDNGYTPKDISNQLNVSYKLIELYLRQFNIPFVSQQP